MFNKIKESLCSWLAILKFRYLFKLGFKKLPSDIAVLRSYVSACNKVRTEFHTNPSDSVADKLAEIVKTHTDSLQYDLPSDIVNHMHEDLSPMYIKSLCDKLEEEFSKTLPPIIAKLYRIEDNESIKIYCSEGPSDIVRLSIYAKTSETVSRQLTQQLVYIDTVEAMIEIVINKYFDKLALKAL